MPLLSDAAKTLAEDTPASDKVSTSEPNAWPDPSSEPEPEPADPIQNVIPIGGSAQTIPGKVPAPDSTSKVGIDKSSAVAEDPAGTVTTWDDGSTPEPASDPLPPPPEPIPTPEPEVEVGDAESKDEQLPAPDPTHEQFDQVDDVAQPSDDNTSTIALSVLGILGVFGGLYVATKKGWL